ncbi:MAG: phosphate starvation-inducible protein PhoH, partial [Actinomycetota bacterium]|nr:phosphate starvation-inducible protein PhoH [Actinomycetota bacterium]
MVALLGERDSFLKRIESSFESGILVRGNEITISGAAEDAELAGRVFEELLRLLERGTELSETAVRETISMVRGIGMEPADAGIRPSDVLGDTLLSARGKGIAPKTMGQKRYVDAIRNSTVTFAIGPAGTGKTYLAVATAVR